MPNESAAAIDANDAATPHCVEHVVATPGGRLHASSWTPAARAGATGEVRAPIVLLHDSLGCVALWRDFPARLAVRTGRRVIAYDRLGFGRSDARAGRPGLDFIGAEAGQGLGPLCKALGLDRVVLFGHSVGGGMAVHGAATLGGATVALITESAQAFVEKRTVLGIEAARDAFADPAHFERLRRYHGDKARWVFDAWVGTWLDPAFAGWSLDPVLPWVRCPLLAIHGRDDEYGSARHPQSIVAQAGGPATLCLMDDTRHVPHREREAAVLEAVVDFLAPLG